MTTRELDVTKQRLKDLGLFGLLGCWESISEKPWLTEILAIEERERQRRTRERRLRSATIGAFKPLADYDWAFHFQRHLTLVGMRTQFFGADSEKNNIGAKLPPLWAAFLERLPEIEGRVAGVCYGVVRQEQPDSDQLEYHAAIEVTGKAQPPNGMVSFEVPASSYARFEHRGAAQQVDHTVSYAYSTWLAQPENTYRHTGGPDLEIYGSAYHPTAATSVIHYALPIA